VEDVASEFGKIKSVKFFENKANGKSKGYAFVEFLDPAAARTCKEKIPGRLVVQPSSSLLLLLYLVTAILVFCYRHHYHHPFLFLLNIKTSAMLLTMIAFFLSPSPSFPSITIE